MTWLCCWWKPFVVLDGCKIVFLTAAWANFLVYSAVFSCVFTWFFRHDIPQHTPVIGRLNIDLIL
nr:MAG TPA: hypothetical protein [Caudoviricetes sp.]DAM26271.1 MAG TPA: hypothetical protein [Caudoviricetes sp.]